MNALILFVTALVMFLLFQRLHIPTRAEGRAHPNLELLWLLFIVAWGLGSVLIMIYVVIRVLLFGAW